MPRRARGRWTTGPLAWPATLTVRALGDEGQDLVGRPHIAVRAVDRVEGGVEVPVAAGGVGVRDHDRAVVEGAGVAGGGLAAHVRQGAGHEDGVDGPLLQPLVEL